MMILFLLLFFFPLIFTIIDASDCGLVLGRSHIRSKRMIIGGTEVNEEGAWPWQISLLKYNETEDRWKWAGCGGTLIGSRWALTAAHCFKTGPIVANYSVLIGSAHASIENDSDEVRLITNIVRHPTYEQDDTNNDDIALLELESSNSNPGMPVCIPSKEQIVPIGIKAVATGYGVSAHYYFDERNAVTTDMKLRQTTLTVHSLLACGREHQMEWRTPPRGVDLGICAGDIGRGPQRGDSGGPLMMKSNDGRWVQIGINSYGTYIERPSQFDKHASATTPVSYPREEGSGEYPIVEGSGSITEQIEEGSGAEVLVDEKPKNSNTIRYVKNRSSFTKAYAYCDWIGKETGGEVKCLEEELTFQAPPNFSDFSE